MSSHCWFGHSCCCCRCPLPSRTRLPHLLLVAVLPSSLHLLLPLFCDCLAASSLAGGAPTQLCQAESQLLQHGCHAATTAWRCCCWCCCCSARTLARHGAAVVVTIWHYLLAALVASQHGTCSASTKGPYMMGAVIQLKHKLQLSAPFRLRLFCVIRPRNLTLDLQQQRQQQRQPPLLPSGVAP